MLHLKNARVICPLQAQDAVMSIYVQDGRIAHLGDSPYEAIAQETVDVGGALLLPGATDIALELQEPGLSQCETVSQTLQMALQGGYTTVAITPLGKHPIISQESVEHRRFITSQQDDVRVLVGGALLQQGHHAQMAHLGDMATAGISFFAHASQHHEQIGLLKDAMWYAKGFERPLFLLGSHKGLEREGVVHEGLVSTRLGLTGIPAAAESIQVATYLELLRSVGLPAVIGPISCRRSVELISRAQDEGLSVYAAASVWNLLFDEGELLKLPYDSAFRLSPPLRAIADKNALRNAVQEGRCLIAPTHQPALEEEKNVEFSLAKPGFGSLSNCLPALLSLWQECTPLQLARAACLLPAQVLNLQDSGHLCVGARADVVVFKPGLTGLTSQSISHFSPLKSQAIHYQVSSVFSLGRRCYTQALFKDT